MERYTYQDGGKWRIRIGDTEHSGQWVDRLAAYEATGLEPEEIFSAVDMAKIACALHELNAYKELGPIDRLRELAGCPRETSTITNGDKIRAMTDEELAKLLLDGCTGNKCEERPQNEYGSVDCFQCRMDYLRQPAEEGVNLWHHQSSD